jgi:hypothetical protein
MKALACELPATCNLPLVPNGFQSLEELEERLLSFQSYCEQVAKPFAWKFTRRNLNVFSRDKMIDAAGDSD